MHDPVEPSVSFPVLEQGVLDWWAEQDIPARALTHREGAPQIVFYEGPPTANAPPGFHHVIARTYKDVYARYHSMKGKFVPRKAGWDCHGLPVEIEVEKKLGFTRKQQIADYGVEAFNQLCRESVADYVAQWERMSERIAFWLDYADAYWTMSPRYMESVWWSLAELHRRGLLYEGHKVAPYCPRCETPLSDHELGQPDAYQDVSDPGITVAFPVVPGQGFDGVSLTIWTTTPWTLISNRLVAVHPDEAYVVSSHDGRRLVYAEARVPEGAVVERRMSGSDLVGVRYRPPYEFADGPDENAWHVVGSREYVTADEGTGLVHMSPGHGAEDSEVCRENGVLMFNAVDRSGRFDGRITPFAGLFVKDADAPIIADLRGRGLLVAEETIVHSYPHCWRCRTPLIYYALTSWYVRTTQFRDRLLAANSEINWVPEHIRDGRMGNWLQNNVDWSLSRYRFWGTPLPIWRCPAGHDTAVESLADLGERAGRDLRDLDPHRPFVDEIAFACPSCGDQSRRVPDLIDVWYDSGAMPFAQHGYPHQGTEEFERRFPAEFISEAIDQTRGWFYTLLAEGVMLFDRSPYRNVVCLELIVDAQGRKMSKSLGNAIDPAELFATYGADAVRFVLTTGSAPGVQKRVSEAAVEKVVRESFLTFWNVYRLYVLYANVDDFDPNTWPDLSVPLRPAIDRWVLSELHQTIADVDEAMARYDCTRAGRRITEFIEDLSNWYVRRSRRRFWRAERSDEEHEDKSAGYWTLWTCLVETSKLLAPLTPFLAEAAYRNLVTNVNPDAPSSVHLADYPRSDPRFIDPALAEGMAIARTLVSLGRNARTQGRVKVRQPLGRAIVLVPPELQDVVEELTDLIADELNVEEIEFAEEAGELVTVTLRPNYPVAGPELGEGVRTLAATLAALNGERAADVASELEAGGEVTLPTPDGGEITAWAELVEIRREPAPGTAFSYEAPFGVSLDLEITEELRGAGLARELVHQLQGVRRELGLDITDRVSVRLAGPEQVRDALNEHEEWVSEELLASEVEWEESLPDGRHLNVDSLVVSARVEPAAEE
jgi:isoleucyl-tRNA synthetase